MTSEGERSGTWGEAAQQWAGRTPVQLLDHGRPCCTAARAWLRAMDWSLRAAEPGSGAPSWLVEVFPWGPTRWPLSWCEAVQSAKLDCGALAAMACYMLSARGLRVWRTQLIQEFSEEAVTHWRSRWLTASAPTDWIIGSLIYHEGVAVLSGGNEIGIWDPTHNCWLESNHRGGYGSTLAIRLHAHKANGEHVLHWAGVGLSLGEWQFIGRSGYHAGVPSGNLGLTE